MPLKIPWQQKNRPAADRQEDFYSHLREKIGEIRRQGEPPLRDGESFSRYVCDLCHQGSPVSSLRQCVICGRWACSSCFHEEFYVCSSCNGIIRLHMIQVPGLSRSPAPAHPAEQGTGQDDCGHRE